MRAQHRDRAFAKAENRSLHSSNSQICGDVFKRIALAESAQIDAHFLALESYRSRRRIELKAVKSCLSKCLFDASC